MGVVTGQRHPLGTAGDRHLGFLHLCTVQVDDSSRRLTPADRVAVVNTFASGQPSEPGTFRSQSGGDLRRRWL